MLLLIDGNNIAWAGFHALRRPMGAETPAQKQRAALLGLTQAVLGFIGRGGRPPGSRDDTPLTGAAVVFDEGRPKRRRGVYPAYQTGREGTPAFTDNEPIVVGAIEEFMALARSLPILVARGVDTEADDLIAWLALRGAPQDEHVRIVSSDRDFLQLLEPGGRVSIFSPIRRILITAENFLETAAPRTSDGTAVAFPTERYLDYRVAGGDASDDLPGIPGVGALTAARLVAMAPLEAYIERPALVTDAVGQRSKRVEGAFRDGSAAEAIARNRELMDLRLAAGRYPSLDGMATHGSWDEAVLRAWVAEQRIAGLDVEAAVRALAKLAGTHPLKTA